MAGRPRRRRSCTRWRRSWRRRDGKARDARATRIGLRTIEVVHERDAEGKSFTIKVNGAPVFMKGANWIPADSFVTRVTDERYRSCCSRPPTPT